MALCGTFIARGRQAGPDGARVETGCGSALPVGNYTRRFLGGRQPLCGTGVMS
jgi:hypothetical protein